MTKGIVISLYDFTGEALKPWAEAGYECYAYDIQHDPDVPKAEVFKGGGSVHYQHADLHDFNTHRKIFNAFNGCKVVWYGLPSMY